MKLARACQSRSHRRGFRSCRSPRGWTIQDTRCPLALLDDPEFSPGRFAAEKIQFRELASHCVQYARMEYRDDGDRRDRIHSKHEAADYLRLSPRTLDTLLSRRVLIA